MQRHIVDKPRAPATGRRLEQYLRLDRHRAPRMSRADRTRGEGRARHYYRIALGHKA